jgi:hypothetical protein
MMLFVLEVVALSRADLEKHLDEEMARTQQYLESEE